MRPVIIFLVFSIFIVLIDLYAFRGLNNLINAAESNLNRKLFTWIYWSITVLMIAGMAWAGSAFQNLRNPNLFYGITLLMGIFLMIYFPKLIFNITQLLSDISLIIIRLFSATVQTDMLRKIFLATGGGLGILLFIAFGMGMIRGKTNVRVFNETITISDLPESFSPLKIVQLSDLHLVGFHRHPDHIESVVKKVNDLKPDLILFTGDMVSNFSEEIDPFIDILNELKAPLGKFAVLGNHDYGHYYSWDSKEQETDNLLRIKQQIRNAGFDLLLNENRNISINGESIDIIGVENWGKPPFPQYGDIEKAREGMNGSAVSILLSHDPSHWDLHVKKMDGIDLTFSGHTHGMQMGIEIGKFRWSPSKWQYRQWAGLYNEDGSYLYVNRGLGFTGFPGRVGIRPEITCMTLSKE